MRRALRPTVCDGYHKMILISPVHHWEILWYSKGDIRALEMIPPGNNSRPIAWNLRNAKDLAAMSDFTDFSTIYSNITRRHFIDGYPHLATRPA
jgi:hypothetical protein